MKRVVAVSDSHGCVAYLRDTIAQALTHGAIDVLVFLGDGLDDLDAVKPMLSANGAQTRLIAVCGNNDWRRAADREARFTVEDARFFACHGHEWNVKYGMERLCFAAREREAQVALFGHTHMSMLEYEYGIWFINPGAVCDRNRHGIAYAELLVEPDGRIRANLIPCG